MEKNTSFRKNSLAVAVTAACMSMPAVGYAQDEGSSLLEEIIVTATRRESSVHDIPFNISAISGSEISNANIVSSQELLRAMPGITSPDSGERLAENNNIITIRGLNVDPSATDRAFLSDPTVSTYVSDTPIYGNFVLRDVNRIEVLRGPQGTLYGSGSLGGTVRYIFNKPDPSEFNGSVSASYGQSAGSDGNNASLDAVLNIPMSDTAAFRLVAGRIDNDGVIDYVNVYATDSNNIPLAEGGDIVLGGPVYENKKDADSVEIDYARASLLLSPNDNFEATVTFMTQDGDFGGRRQQTSGPNGWDEYYGENEIGAVILEPANTESDMASLEFQYDFGFATLSSSTSTYERSYIGTSDNSGFFAARGWMYWYGYASFPRPAFAAERQNSEEGFVQELRLASNANDSKVDWVVGAFYIDQEASAAQQTELRGFQEWHMAADPDGDGVSDDFGYIGGYYDLSNNVSFDWTYDSDFQDFALFGEVTWHASDAVDVTLGARRFDNEHSVTSQTAFPIWFLANPVVSETNEDDDILLKANISWQASDDTMVYGTISEGYRRGGTNAAPVRPDVSYPNDPEWGSFGSDSVVNFEIGVKGRAENLSYTIAAFNVDWDDPQLNVATPEGAYYAVANGDEARSRGLESEFRWQVNENFRLSGGYTYVDAKLTKDLLLHDASDLTDGKSELRATKGARMPVTAEHTINLAGTHSLELNNGLSLMTRVDGYYQSDVANSILNIDPNWDAELGGFSLWNLSVALSSDNWSVGLYAKNIFDEDGTVAIYKEEYMTSAPGLNFFGTGQKDFIARTRTISLAATYRF
jgi:outer membrane receptor protein involved in Fe transport